MGARQALIEVLRGPLVESHHHGSISVMDDEGREIFSWGDIKRAIYPRSAVKAIQALALVESGAAERFAFSDAELAMACASHSGEPMHIDAAGKVLKRLGLSEEALECGSHWPMSDQAARDLARADKTPSALHNNCSGKHCGFLALAVHRRLPPANYVAAEHPVQGEVRQMLEELVGVALEPQACGTDGCSIPTYAMPIDRLALAFARFGSGKGLSAHRAKAAARLRQACAAAPQMVAGTGRYCTDVMRLFGQRVFIKTGAEGVFCGAFPDAGLGFTLKIDDGATRASEAATSQLIARFVTMSDSEQCSFAPFIKPTLRNWRGIETGGLRASEAFNERLAQVRM